MKIPVRYALLHKYWNVFMRGCKMCAVGFMFGNGGEKCDVCSGGICDASIEELEKRNNTMNKTSMWYQEMLAKLENEEDMLDMLEEGRRLPIYNGGNMWRNLGLQGW